MSKQQAIDLVKKTFESPFDKTNFVRFIKNLLNQIDEATFTRSGNYIPVQYRPYINQYERIGKYTDGENRLDILIVRLKKNTSIERARSMQRNFIAGYLQGNYGSDVMKEAALVAFVSPESEDWRFSLVRMEHKLEETGNGKLKAKEEYSPARRWSFLVGRHEKSHTAQSRLVPILANDQHNPTLGELEEAFNIETVTKEFFIEYRGLFIKTKEELDKAVQTNPRTKADFEAKGINTVDLAKKLLGQIVFLYYLQKKGWFGVPRDGEWGEGSKNFLRELFEKKQGGYNNFFNDVLEPLFYEALRNDRSHDGHYYSRFNCKIPFLNGGLFDPMNNYDWVRTDILLPNELFSNQSKTKEGDIGNGILDIFDRYNFTVKEDEPFEKEVAIDPELLGKAYEKFNAIRPDNYDEFLRALKSGKKGEESKFNKQYGVYYTPREIVHYMCQQSLINYLSSVLSPDPIYQNVGDERLSLFGNEYKVGQQALVVEYHTTPAISKEDISFFIQQGARVLENEAAVNAQGKETETYSYQLPEQIRVNAPLIDQKLASIKVCDPAVGSGAFPVGMMTEIVNARQALETFTKAGKTVYDLKRECIENSLYGVDIDPGAVEIAKLRLWLSLVVDEDDPQNIKPLPNLDYKVVCGNSLLGVEKNLFNHELFTELEKFKPLYFNATNPTSKQEYKNKINSLIDQITNGRAQFDFEIYFSEVFHEKDGFDLVIGNPPYVRVQNLPYQLVDLYKKFWATAWKRIDISTLFIELGLTKLSNNGTLCLITSNQFTTTEYGRLIRKYLLQNKAIDTIIDFGDLPIFESALTYVSIFICTKRNNESIKYYKLPSLPFSIPKRYAEVSYSSLSEEVWSLGEKDDLSLVKKMQNHSKRLDSYAKCWAGIFTGKDDLLLFDINENIEKIERELLIPVLRASDCQRYSLSKPSKLSFYPYEEIDNSTRLIQLEEIKNRFPKAYEFILSNMEILKSRKDSRITIGEKGNWHGIIRFGKLSRFRKPKIVSPGEVRNNKFSLDITGSAFSCARVFSITVESQHVDIKFLLGLLNSKLIEFYLHKTASLKQGGYYSYSSSVIDAIPVNDACIKNQGKIIKLVDQIIDLKKNNPDSNTSSLEKAIDKTIFEMYNLNASEIYLVENS